MASMSRVNPQRKNDFSRLGDVEAGRTSRTSRESIAVDFQLYPPTAQETSAKVTSQRQSPGADKAGCKRSQADECEKVWAELYDKLEDGSYEKYPEGWPRLASFLDGCASFSIFRRFGHLATRILVNYMTIITRLEKQLRDLDNEDALPDGKAYRLRNLEIGSDTSKEDLLALIEDYTRQYYQFLMLYNRVRGLGQASKRDHDSVFVWVHLNKPVDKGYYEWINFSEDFVSIVSPPKHNAIEALIWKCLISWPSGWFMRYFGFEKKSKQPKEETVKYLTKERIVVVARLVIAVLAVTVLFIPIALFLLVPMSKAYMAITVSVFLVVFAVMMSLFAEVGVQEVFIGTATYGAVMVTFLGNLQSTALAVAA